MTNEAKTDAQLIFRDIKAAADVDTVLEYIGVRDGLKEQGVELVGWCPLGTKRHGKKDSLAINREKKVYQCFSCDSKGSILDFVAHVERIHIRDAAYLVQQINNGELTPGDDETDDAAEEPPEQDEPEEQPQRRDKLTAQELHIRQIRQCMDRIDTEIAAINLTLDLLKKAE